MKPADDAFGGNGGDAPSGKTPGRSGVLVAVLLIWAVTFAAFWQVRHHHFVGFDDDRYVTENRYVRQGLTLDGTAWAFTTAAAANWHPVTWLSHMADVEIFGLDPGRHHLVNLLLHGANASLLLLVLHAMTGALWRSAFVAALFAVHPLHVESVAWIAERKDVLSTLFWMLTLRAYLRYVKKPSGWRYASVVMFFAFGLMSKPMAVTLPLVLLLLDYWPLGRYGTDDAPARPPFSFRSSMLPLVREKIPLFLLSAGSCIVTFVVQAGTGAMVSTESFPFGVRAANALVSYASYLGKTVWPAGLAVYYPHPGQGVSLVHAGASLLLLLGVSVVAVRRVRRSPYLAVGWSWYLGTLVPVIGLVQVGGQAMADRYTYVPLIGIFIAVSWGVPDLLQRIPFRGPVFAVLGGGSVAAFAVLAWIQAGHWRTTETLFGHALAVTENNALAHSNLGAYHAKQGRKEKAVSHFREALRIDPGDAVSHNNLGVILDEEGDYEGALKHFHEAIRHHPRYALAHVNLGHTLLTLGSPSEAVPFLATSIGLDPEHPKAHELLGKALEIQGDLREASDLYRTAARLADDDADVNGRLALLLLRLGEFEEAEDILRKMHRNRPDDTQAGFNLGLALFYLGRNEEAVSTYRRVLERRPDDPRTRINLGMALAALGNLPEAITEFREALRLSPRDLKALNGLGAALAENGDPEEAVRIFRLALRIRPDDATTHFNLAMALDLSGKTGDAIRHFRTGLSIDPQNREAEHRLDAILARSGSGKHR